MVREEIEVKYCVMKLFGVGMFGLPDYRGRRLCDPWSVSCTNLYTYKSAPRQDQSRVGEENTERKHNVLILGR